MTKNRLPGGVLLVFPLGLLLCGCGRGGPETIEIQGRVEFDGGTCPAGGTVYFTPIAAASGEPLRPASGNFQTDGKFTVSSFGEGDGLVPGTYRVRVECWKQPPGDDGTPGISYVKAGYQAPDLTIEAGTRGPVDVEYDVPLAAD
jgi:hypothetical protein